MTRKLRDWCDAYKGSGFRSTHVMYLDGRFRALATEGSRVVARAAARHEQDALNELENQLECCEVFGDSVIPDEPSKSTKVKR